MDKICFYFFSSTTVGRLLILLTSVAGVIRCEQHRLKFLKNHVKKILKLPPVDRDEAQPLPTW